MANQFLHHCRWAGFNLFTMHRWFNEEIREIMISGGLEYWYRQQFAIRGGYFYEHELKGNRKILCRWVAWTSMYFILIFPISYLPQEGLIAVEYHAFTLGLDFDKKCHTLDIPQKLCGTAVPPPFQSRIDLSKYVYNENPTRHRTVPFQDWIWPACLPVWKSCP